MNTLTTYFYKGDNVSDAEQTYICPGGPHCYMTAYIDILIMYGVYIGADVVPSTQPKFLPPLMNVEFNAQIYKFNGGPTSRFAAAPLIARQDIYDLDNPRECLGTKFTFQGPAMENCTDNFCLVWSTNRIEMPYGPDMIFINAQNGVSNNWQPCD